MNKFSLCILLFQQYLDTPVQSNLLPKDVVAYRLDQTKLFLLLWPVTSNILLSNHLSLIILSYKYEISWHGKQILLIFCIRQLLTSTLKLIHANHQWHVLFRLRYILNKKKLYNNHFKQPPFISV